MNLFDANTWIGRWPFAFCDAHSARSLKTHLAKHGIARALVSPLDAVFAPEPGPANRHLLASTRGVRGLEPVPVINPAHANWFDEVAVCASDDRVRAVRLLPNYHNYSLRDTGVSDLIEELEVRGLKLIVQMRLIDDRHEYHAMTIKPVPADDFAALLKRHKKTTILVSGLMRPDVLKLAPKFPNLLCDLSFAEWHDTMEHLLGKVSEKQLVFASHTPFLVTAAARAKLETSTLKRSHQRAVAEGNLDKFLR